MKKGRILLATGPMFSGKTTWLINKLQLFDPQETLVIKYLQDNRYTTASIATHYGKKLKAVKALDEKDILKELVKRPGVKTLGVDELQFFKPTILELFEKLKDKNFDIYTAALNVDYNNKPWETTEKALLKADEVINLVAICAKCGRHNATITNRRVSSGKRVVIGGREMYESLCKEDYFGTTSR